jgi:pyridoxal phosphate enzyme (YggS family)
MGPEPIRQNLESVRRRMAEAARRAGREPGSVRLVAVTKRSTVEVVRRLVACGAADLGENYPQELWAKADALRDLSVRWHLIGHLQGNKAKKTFPMVRMIHSVDSIRLLRTLDELAENATDPPPVCLQVNASGEATKHGWSPESILAEAEAIAGCRRIPVVGLMTMAALGPTAEDARPAFARLRTIRDDLRTRTGLPLVELSMGMSHDFEVAIEEGATWVRVGSALFEGVEP